MTTSGQALAFTLYVGAAIASANPDQREQLRTTVRPLLDQYRRDGDEQPIRQAVAVVLGADWQPAEQWVNAIAIAGRPDTTEKIDLMTRMAARKITEQLFTPGEPT